MKLSTSLFLALALTAHAAQFEGRVHLQRVEATPEPKAPPLRHDIIYSVKGDKVRVEVVRERVNTFITDTAAKETMAILEDDMAYMVLPSLAPDPDALELERTDETTTILDHPVRKYTLESDEGTTELWIADDLGPWVGLGEGYEKPPKQEPNVDLPDPPMPRSWEWSLAGERLFPLRVITRDYFDREIYRLEAKAITPAPLADPLFRPSPNYKRVDSWPEQ